MSLKYGSNTVKVVKYGSSDYAFFVKYGSTTVYDWRNFVSLTGRKESYNSNYSKAFVSFNSLSMNVPGFYWVWRYNGSYSGGGYSTTVGISVNYDGSTGWGGNLQTGFTTSTYDDWWYISPSLSKGYSGYVSHFVIWPRYSSSGSNPNVYSGLTGYEQYVWESGNSSGD